MYLLDSPPYNYKMPEYTDTRIKNKKNRGDGWPHITQTEAMDGLTSLGYIWFLTFLLFQERCIRKLESLSVYITVG